MKVRIKQNNRLNMNRKYSCRFDENDCLGPGLLFLEMKENLILKKLHRRPNMLCFKEIMS